jgi:hypothetical protein
MNSIYVTRRGDFVLGDFQYSCSLEELQGLEKYPLKYMLPNEKLKPPVFENKKRDLILFIEFLKEEFKEMKVEVKKLNKWKDIKLNNEFIDTLNQFRRMKVLSNEKKEIFFQHLMEIQIEKKLFLKRILPILLQIDILIEPKSEIFYNSFFTLDNNWLNEIEFNQYITPFLIRNFSYNKHKGLRIILLNYLKIFIWNIKPHIVQSVFMDEILRNLKEKDEEIFQKSIESILMISIYFLKCDEQYQLEIGSTLINENILVSLHHHSVKNVDVSRRMESILCMLKLWRLKNVRKEIILSSIQFNLGENSTNEMRELVLNLILINLKITWNFHELVNDILPCVSILLLNENENIRKISTTIFKECMFLMSSQEVVDQPPLYKSLIPQFPPISNVTLETTNHFKDGLMLKK